MSPERDMIELGERVVRAAYLVVSGEAAHHAIAVTLMTGATVIVEVRLPTPFERREQRAGEP